MELNINWLQFKTIQSQIQFNINYIDLGDTYSIWGTDGIMSFFTNIITIDEPASGSYQWDFEQNYINPPEVELNKVTYGRPLVQSTARPEGTTSYFTCAGDSDDGQVISGGDELIFNLTEGASGESQYVDVHFKEDIWIKDGQVWSDKDTPFGAYVDIEIIHPVYQIPVGSFGRKILLMPDWVQPLDTEDRGLLPAGMIVRVIVYNSDGTGKKEAPAPFKVIGRLEIYRAGQV